uniref:glutamic acid-rich protein-like n=1 Tax=Erigeron canadensis TaxID=72917 RepID=UPI001CB8BF19|nr:glutamic acid-rich protein-like [Erigeron canadensis]
MERPRWRKRQPDDEDDLNHIYDVYKDLFTIHVHYDGKFTKNPNREYVDGKIQAFDFIEHDIFSMHDMNDMITELGYDGIMYYHFLLPEKDLDVGLRPLGTDKDIIKMISYVPKFQETNVYVEHGVTTLEDYFLPKTGCIIEEIDAELNVVDFKNSRFRKPLLIEGPGEQSKQSIKETIVEQNVTEKAIPNVMNLEQNVNVEQNVEGYGSNVEENEADDEENEIEEQQNEADEEENETEEQENEADEEENETEEQENEADEEENESRTEGDDSEDGDFEPEKERDVGDDDNEEDEHIGGGAALDKEGDDDYEIDMSLTLRKK